MISKIVYLGYLIFFLTPIGLIAQSLSYDDLINLQQNNLEKAKGFFSYKGWTWMGTTKDCSDCLKQGDYDLSYDKTTWSYSNESIQLLQRAGYANAVVYSTTESGFNALEAEAKTHLSSGGTGTDDNRIWSVYKGQGLKFTFNQKKRTDSWYNTTTYSLIISNESDVSRYVSELCSVCKGKGQITEYEKCSYCNGDGRQNCSACRGKGGIYCDYCKQGKVQCNKCYGDGKNTCNKCYGDGTKSCGKCYGDGSISCSRCYGSGKVSYTLGGVGIPAKCSQCKGNGRLTCQSCAGKGAFTCEGCGGAGTLTCSACTGGMVTCSRCAGNYFAKCINCMGTGNSDMVCSYCKGTGNSSRQIKKVCGACNGSKLASK